ncbi:MAG: glycosyltransferase family 4 protein [Patescibacteria group bacterium]|nr:glycosyltransferase family 4 protein [Patescibacteria group bacterium]
MKILFFSRLYNPHIGGVEKHVESLGLELSKKKHQVTIITEGYQPNLPSMEAKHRIKIYRIPTHKTTEKDKKWLIWRWLWQHINLLKSADIIHVHDVGYWWLPYRFVFPLKKVFMTFHGYEGTSSPTILAIVQRKISEWLSSGTIGVGDFMRTWYRAQPNLVSYGAVQSSQLLKSPTQSNCQLFRAIYLGRLSQDIGIMTYLQALKILQKQGVKIKLDVFGDGHQFIEAKQFVKKNKLNVIFKGMVKNANQYLPNYKLAFVSSYLAILEAMRAQVPVIAVFNNQIKQDYLTCHPQAKNMLITNRPIVIAYNINQLIEKEKINRAKLTLAYNWAKTQTWQNLTTQYLKLWQTKA